MASIHRLVVGLLIMAGVFVVTLQMDQEAWLNYFHEATRIPLNVVLLQSQKNRTQELSQEFERNSERVKAKRELAQAVLAKRMTLREAAIKFGEVSRDTPYTWDIYATQHPEWSTECRYAQYVIDQVSYLLCEKDNSEMEILAVLEAEKASW